MSKYRIKSSSAILKRFKVTSTGKYLRHKAGRSHLLQKKTAKRKQFLRKIATVKCSDRILLKCKLLR